MEDIIPEIKREYIISLLEQGKRIDDRGFDDYRDISIETGLIEKAEGSARVKFGKTQRRGGGKGTRGEALDDRHKEGGRSEEKTSELEAKGEISYAV